MSFITRAIGTVQLAAKAHAPTIMVVTGVVAMGAAVVTAGKQTLKVEEVLEKHTPQLENIVTGENLGLANYDKEDAFRDRMKVYGAASYDLGKVYFVPGVLFLGGAALIFGGHRVMLRRNATLALAFTAVSNAFDKYRENVRQSFGEDTDQAMMRGWVTKEIVDPETGKVETIQTADWTTTNDPYARVFEQGGASQWRPDRILNEQFCRLQQKFAQEKLIRTGTLYLSEVYEALGIPESDVSRVVGWKVGKLADGSKNIPFVDFGLDKPLPDDWKFAKDAAIYLDFNCQGLIVGGRVQAALEQA